MRAMATYIMRGRMQAIVATAGLGALSLLVNPVVLLSSASVGLVTLVQGPREGLLNIIGSLLVLGVLGAFIAGEPLLALVFASLFWIPSWLLGSTLRYSQSLSAVLSLAGVLGIVMVLASYIVLDDPAPIWQYYFDQSVFPALKKAGWDAQALAHFQLQLDTVAMTGLVAAAWSLGIVLSMLMIRWWQSALYHPNAFRREFHQLRFGSVFAWSGIVIVLVSSLSTGRVEELFSNIVRVGTIIFLFQALAVLHSILAQRAITVGWFVVMYVSLFFALLTMPYVLPLLAIVGLMDNHLDFRSRFGQRSE